MCSSRRATASAPAKLKIVWSNTPLWPTLRWCPSPTATASAGTARADTRFKVGDSWTWRVFDRHSGAEKGLRTQTVTEITDTEVRFNNGRLVTDLLGNLRLTPDGRRITAAQFLPLEFSVGRQWTTRFQLVNAGGANIDSEYTFRIAAKEKITVPAGTFDCFRVEGKGISRIAFQPGSGTLLNNYWVAPEISRRGIKQEVSRIWYGPRGVNVLEDDRIELVSFKQG